MSRNIAKAMLIYKPCPNFEARLKKPDLSSWGLTRQSLELLHKEPNAFLVAALFDHLIDARNAWEVPFKLKERLGHLDLSKIEKMPTKKLASIIKGSVKGESLHRFPNKMAERLKIAAQLLMEKYDGNAKNIWLSGKPNAKEVIKRLVEFNGIAQKIANMVTRLLVTYYGVEINGWEKIDIAVDRHVARVFLRSGLIEKNERKTAFRVSDVRESIIKKAIELSPKYPGALDEPSFLIGKIWCQADYAYCEVEEDDEDGPCPLSKVCQKNIQFGVA